MQSCLLVRASRANIARFFVRLRRYEGRGTPSPCTPCQGTEFPKGVSEKGRGDSTSGFFVSSRREIEGLAGTKSRFSDTEMAEKTP